MGSQVVLDPTKKVFDDSGGRVYAKSIVLDDDSSMRAHLQHPSTDEKFKIPELIPEPTFKADQSHRVKVISANGNKNERSKQV